MKNTQQDSDKIAQITKVVALTQTHSEEQEKWLSSMNDPTNQNEKMDFYQHWIKRSQWLSNRISPIISSLLIQGKSSDTALLEAIKDYVQKKGKIKHLSEI